MDKDAPKNKVLIVEDEALLRQSMARGLASLAGVEVLEAATLEEAKRQLARQLPQLLLTDLHLPDGAGIDLLVDLDRIGLRIPVIFISGYLGHFRHRIPARLDLDVKEKPVPLEELRRLVQERIGRREVPDTPFSLADYVQLALMGRHSLVLTVERGGHPLGRVITHGGEVWSAKDDRGAGDAAVQRLFVVCSAGNDTAVRCRTLVGDPPPRDVASSGPALLLEAARLMDERRTTDLDELPEISPKELTPLGPPRSEDFEALFDAGVDALLRKDYEEALAAFHAASTLRPTDTTVAANLKRLANLGFHTKERGS